MTSQARKISTGVAAGVAGGLMASWVMNRFQAAAGKLSHDKPDKGEPATVKAASAVSESTAHHKLTPDEKKIAGPLVHYLMGGVSGGIYGAAAAAVPASAVGFGSLFGAAVWLFADEIMVPALGLSKKPNQVPFAKHAMALASHLVYGLATDGTRRAITAAL